MIILGIDPGTSTTGYAVVETTGSSIRLIDYGTIRPPAALATSKRYLIIYKGVLDLIAKFHPEACSIETQFIYKNPKSALTLGMAKGAAMIACAQADVSVFEYNPSQVKAAVTGNGHASKEQMAAMLRLLCNLKEAPTPLDASDALALCFCHRNRLCTTLSAAR